jgi:hypothetical protein
MNRPVPSRTAAAAGLTVTALLGCIVPSLAWGQGAPRGDVFTCVNAAGRTLTSDRLIADCMDREQRVLARDGTLLRVVPPSLTVEERAAKEERERKLVEEKKAREEAVRRDRLLVQRFPNEAEHQKARDAALEAMRGATAASQNRIADLGRERKPLLEEAEFYKGKTLPAALKQQLDANDAALAAQRDSQANQQAEIERIGRRFDAELAQLKRLWGGAAPGSLASAATVPDAKASKPIKPAATQTR